MEDRDRQSLLRVLDANLNRAAEALRTVEEMCRFHWNLSGFSRDLKALRHEVLAAVAPTPERRAELIAARDVPGDVGRAVESPTAATSPTEVAIRNLERAKEALRSLEEASRAAGLESAGRIEAARHALYAIEKGLARLAVPGGDSAAIFDRLAGCRLCLLATRSSSRRPLEGCVREAIHAGTGMIQLREKSLDDRALLAEARALRELTARLGAIFVVNDRADLAALAEADGVHVGQSDLSVAEARRIVGPGRLVGVSTHSVAQARAAERDGADYIGVGPMFATLTKDAGPILGPEGLRDVLAAITIPAFAIGGLNSERVPLIRSAGGTRVAVSSAVLSSDFPGEAVKAILEGMGSTGGQGRSAR